MPQRMAFRRVPLLLDIVLGPGAHIVEIHKPKAVHGWRELLKEIGIIVIGVVIALGAEQAVDAIHWMHQVDAGEAILKGAFAREVQNAALRDARSEEHTSELQSRI